MEPYCRASISVIIAFLRLTLWEAPMSEANNLLSLMVSNLRRRAEEARTKAERCGIRKLGG
jgi:hypothetical protein